VPRGLELKIGEKLAEMARLNEQQKKPNKDNDHD